MYNFFTVSYISIYFILILVFNIEPDFTREGGSIPVTLTFQELTGKNVLLLPIGIFILFFDFYLILVFIYIIL